MMLFSDIRVLYRVAAGPSVGFGHLVRCRSLARAVGEHPLVSIRGSEATRRIAASSGWTVINASAVEALRAICPDVVVVDDPSARTAALWIRAARRAGIPVAAIHDLGLGYVESDLGIDGSVLPRRGMCGRVGDLTGAAFTILDPAFAVPRPAPVSAPGSPARVLIALGGGAHVRRLATAFADAIAARVPDVSIRAASGFTPGALPAPGRVRWVRAKDGLAAELAAAAVVVCAGGVTLYEACALGRPAVAVALTNAQQLTIDAIARRGAAVNARGADSAAPRVAAAVERLLRRQAERESLAVEGRRLVDGRGAFRVADALRMLAFGRTERLGVGHAA